MKKAFFIGIASGPGPYQLTDIRISGPVNKGMIRLTGNHNPYIQTGAGCHFQSAQHCVIRNKIRCLNINMMACSVNQLKIVVTNLPVRGVRSTGNDLNSQRLPGRTNRHTIRLLCPYPIKEGSLIHKITNLLKKILSRCIIPIQSKTDLKADHRISRNPQMSIPPVSKLGIPPQILPSHIETAYIACMTVNYNYLSVISVIHAEI